MYLLTISLFNCLFRTLTSLPMCSLTPRPRLTTWRTGSGQIWIAGPSLTLPWKVGGLVLDLHSQEEDRDIPLLELNTLYFLSFSLFIIFFVVVVFKEVL